MSNPLTQKLFDYMRKELGISDAAIAAASRKSISSLNQFPIVLWQMGLVSLEQVERIFDWLETAPSLDTQAASPSEHL